MKIHPSKVTLIPSDRTMKIHPSEVTLLQDSVKRDMVKPEPQRPPAPMAQYLSEENKQELLQNPKVRQLLLPESEQIRHESMSQAVSQGADIGKATEMASQAEIEATKDTLGIPREPVIQEQYAEIPNNDMSWNGGNLSQRQMPVLGEFGNSPQNTQNDLSFSPQQEAIPNEAQPQVPQEIATESPKGNMAQEQQPIQQVEPIQENQQYAESIGGNAQEASSQKAMEQGKEAGLHLRDNAESGLEAGAGQEASKITNAAISANGKIYTGADHAEAIAKAEAEGTPKGSLSREKDGLFQTSDGRIITRDEAQSEFGIRNSHEVPELAERQPKKRKATKIYSRKRKG
jgi:hypothetical protein